MALARRSLTDNTSRGGPGMRTAGVRGGKQRATGGGAGAREPLPPARVGPSVRFCVSPPPVLVLFRHFLARSAPFNCDDVRRDRSRKPITY